MYRSMGVVVKASELVALLLSRGFVIMRQAGSHIQLKHVAKAIRVTVPMSGKDLPIGTLKSILRQANISWKDFLKILGR